ncbi:MAG: ABC transporter ATP-binding protein, partial [Clostridiales bacterium]|nr:ABC transporter ATP-binding protein [Clostridiales bacterium]
MSEKKPSGMPGSGPGGHGPNAVMVRGEKAKDFRGTFRKLVRYMGRYKISLAFVFIFAVVATVFDIVGPKILGNVTTSLFEGIMNKISGTGSGVDFGYIGTVMAWLLAIYVISALFGCLQGFIMTDVSMKVTYRFRRDIAAKIQRLPFKYYDTTTNGEVLSHITNDVDAIMQSLNQSVTQIITSVTTVLGILIMMFSISWQMTLVALGIIPVSMGFILTIVKKSQKHFTAQQEYLGHVNGHIEEMYGSHVVVKAFNGEADSVQKFGTFNNTLYVSAWKSQFLSGLLMPIMNFISNLGYVAICILGGYLAVNGKLSVGDIQAFMQYVRRFTQPMTQVANISNILQQTAAAAERIFAFLEQPEEQPESAHPIRVNRTDEPDTELNIHIQGSVQFAHVHFGYNPDKIVIKDFCANVQPGQKIAIVGPTGAGKTTIVKLLMRFYDVNEGA